MSTTARKAELSDLLTKIRAAIALIVGGGQAYSAEGLALTRADLRTLRQLEKDYALELSRLERGKGRRVFGATYR